MLERVTALPWNDRTQRLRLPLRLGLWLLVLVLLGLLTQFAIGLLAAQSIESLLVLVTPGWSAELRVVALRNFAFVSAQLVTMVGSVYLAARFLDRRWFSDFGFRFDRSWWTDLGFGLALGAVLMTGVFLFELLLGWITIRELFFIARADFAFWPWFGWGFVTFVVVGVYEELLFRGYLITNLAEGLTWFQRVGAQSAVGLAVVVTSLFFGLAHAANPNANLASATGIVVAALMLAGGYVLTGELAIPIGVHVTWNFFQGTVYGFPVSGTNDGVALLAIEQAGPAVITGGAFGPEAGVVGIVASLTGLALIAGWVQWREGQLRIPSSLTNPDLRR